MEFSGVSGSGKSSIIEWIVENFEKQFASFSYYEKGRKKNIFPINSLNIISQKRSKVSKRSVIAIYMKIFDDIREVLSKTSLARERGYDKSYFSFNSNKGYCIDCMGTGEKQIEMHFISDINLLCETCQGKRYRNEILDIYLNGKNINQIWQLTFKEAYDFFYNYSFIQKKIKRIIDAGLGYLQLGFKTNQLSNGEFQRLKITYELSFKSPSSTLYILDEPTAGLHFRDIEIFMKLVYSLIKKGATIIVVEHNVEFLRSVDYLIDIGPEAGENGGKVLAQGSIETIKSSKISYTGQFL